MVAVMRHQVIVRIHGADRADCDRFLPDIEVQEARDLAERVLLRCDLLEAPDQDHQAIHLEKLALGERYPGQLAIDCAGHRILLSCACLVATGPVSSTGSTPSWSSRPLGSVSRHNLGL
jgi:hypothetical protein